MSWRVRKPGPTPIDPTCCSTNSPYRPGMSGTGEMPETVVNRLGGSDRSATILAVDVGAGTQDILVYDPERTPENCFRLVLPSQTQIVGRRIRAVTDSGKPLHLTGDVMGGGASTSA